jgi:DNA-binding transcriptional LysR family regulator
MELSDLKVFAVVSRHHSLSAASLELHLTPSALSKALRRLEASLGATLFDRSAKQLKLNRQGRQLLPRALEMIRLGDQTRSELLGNKDHVQARVAGPSMLLWRCGAELALALQHVSEAHVLHLLPMYEDEALAALKRGEVDFALVTAAVADDLASAPKLRAELWHRINMVLCAGAAHPLAKPQQVSSAEVLEHDFACPTRSMLCGAERGTHSDGWRDDRLPRRIRYWVDDLHVLLALVKAGVALAYLPEFALSDPSLRQLKVNDCPFTCVEQVHLLHAPSLAHGWQARLLAQVLRQN